MTICLVGEERPESGKDKLAGSILKDLEDGLDDCRTNEINESSLEEGEEWNTHS